jgi:hypothetical protein
MPGSHRRLSLAVIVLLALELRDAATPLSAQTAIARIDNALQNITNLARAERVGYATFWDSNKFVQCRRMPNRDLRCEAAGTILQPSLKNVLTDTRLNRLDTLGWIVDPAFGNYVNTFAPNQPTLAIANQIERILREAYGADMTALDISTRWVADIPCPPRVGRSQNLAGSVNDLPSMSAVVLRTCTYTAPPVPAPAAASAIELIAIYGGSVAVEIQRLRINARQRVWVIFDAGIGYVQCRPDGATDIACEGQSIQSWPALTAILTPQRIALLHQMGYADPGITPNYSKSYPQKTYTDSAIAAELLTVLFEVYGYTGAGQLKIKTETPN